MTEQQFVALKDWFVTSMTEVMKDMPISEIKKLDWFGCAPVGDTLFDDEGETL